MNQRFYNMLGLCRRAGKVSRGHDAAITSVSKRKARACFLTQDASERLKQEFERNCTYDGRKIPVVVLPCTMNELYTAVGIRGAVVTIDDAGFASKLLQLIEEDNA